MSRPCQGCSVVIQFILRNGRRLPIEPKLIPVVRAAGGEPSFAVLLEDGQTILQRMRQFHGLDRDPIPLWGRVLHFST